MGGKSNTQKDAERMQLDNTKMQADMFKQFMDASKARTGQMDTLMKPATDYFTKLASGDTATINSANSVPISGITRSFDSAKYNIMDSMNPGAGRQFTLGQLERDKANQMAGLPQQSYLTGLTSLAKIGSGMGDFALQQAGAGMRSGEASTSGAGQIIQGENQRKATQMGFLGQMAGVGGFMAGKAIH